MEAVRIGLVGLGKIAIDRHLPTIAADPSFVLAGVADPTLDPADHGVPAFRSHGEMLAALPDLDAVAICTPPLARTRIALEAIEAGCDVLLEKPPTASVADLQAIAAAAAAAGRVAFTAWHSQHNAAVERARALLAGAEVAEVAVTWTEDGERYHPGQTWIWREGGFGVFDAGINGLSVLTRILPQRPVVLGVTRTIPAGAETPIAARVTLGLGAPPHPVGEVVLDWRPEAGQRREVTVRTRAGTVVRLLDSGGRLLVDGAVLLDGPRAEYPTLYAHFGRLVRERRSDVDVNPLTLALEALGCRKSPAS